MGKSYEAKDIQVLEGLDAVRMRPGMYIGTTGVKGLHHLLWEIVDNAVDEATNGFADRIEITLHKDESVTVTDNGRGIPVDEHPRRTQGQADEDRLYRQAWFYHNFPCG